MMLMKKNLPSIFKSKDSTTKSPWELWPSCKNPKTLSFRAGDHVFKTVNSIFFDPISDGIETPESLFTNSSESSYSTESEIDGKSLEILVRGARSERLFFELEDTSSILEKSKMNNNNNNNNKKELVGYKESLVISMESENPYDDFRKSMEEMVESHGVKDWEGLEELLGWYLKMNWRKNHEFIVGAFVDLLVDILISSSSSSFSEDSNYYTCVESSSSSSDSSSLSLIHRSMKKEIDEEEDDEEQIRVKL